MPLDLKVKITSKKRRSDETLGAIRGRKVFSLETAAEAVYHK